MLCSTRESICQDYACVAVYDKFNERVKTYKLSLNSGRCHQFDALLNFNMLVILTTKQTQDMAAVQGKNGRSDKKY